MSGMDLKPLGIFPPVSYPVSRGTPMISPLIKWDHSQSWNVPDVEKMFITSGGGAGCSFEVDVSEESPDQYMLGHVIDGRVLYPATGYLVLVWRAIAKMNGQSYDKTPIVFENIHLHRATIVQKSGETFVLIFHNLQ